MSPGFGRSFQLFENNGEAANMKKLFYLGICGLVLFELANVYFIMPMPFSQRMRSIDVAYFLYTWRWFFRFGFAVIALVGLWSAWSAEGRQKWLVPASVIVAGLLIYALNFGDDGAGGSEQR
jgi:hypothetical protein